MKTALSGIWCIEQRRTEPLFIIYLQNYICSGILLPAVITAGNLTGIGGKMDSRKTITREMIVETAAGMIEENCGIRNVTLREIAKRLGCAHTNLYNYFSGLSEIYWEVAGWILTQLIADARLRELREKIPEGNIFSMLSQFVDFSIDHPGWYQFLWLESLVGEPSPHVVEVLQSPTDYIGEAVRKTAGMKVPDESVKQIGDIMFNYTYGEISTWIHQRSAGDSREALQKRIDTNLHLIYSLMLQGVK